METPFRMKESYNNWFRSGKRNKRYRRTALGPCIFGNKKSRELAEGLL